jgi:hypothetical protein
MPQITARRLCSVGQAHGLSFLIQTGHGPVLHRHQELLTDVIRYIRALIGWRGGSNNCLTRLRLLKQAVESCAGVVGVARRRAAIAGLVRCSRRRSRGIARHRDTRFEQRAIVGLILDHYTYRYRLHALKARRRLKVGTLLAAVERGMALGALGWKIRAGRQRGGTAVAASSRHRLYQARQTRAGHIDRRARASRTRTFVTPGIVVSGEVAVGFLITALIVLSIAVHNLARRHSLNVDLQLALWWLETGNFGYERRQGNQTWGHLNDWMLTNCQTTMYHGTAAEASKFFFGLIADRQFGFWTLDAAGGQIVSGYRLRHPL